MNDPDFEPKTAWQLYLLPALAFILALLLILFAALQAPALAEARTRQAPSPSVATYLDTAATYWGRSGVTPTWEWGACPKTEFVVACAWQGADHIVYQRAEWDRFTRYEKCAVTIHEYGHAVMNLQHAPETVMAPTLQDQVAAAPAACFSPPYYARRIYIR
jgi:hypothetical protein